MTDAMNMGGGDAQFNMALATLQRMDNLLKNYHAFMSVGNTEIALKELIELTTEVAAHVKDPGEEERLYKYIFRYDNEEGHTTKIKKAMMHQTKKNMREWLRLVMQLMRKYKLLMAQSDDPRHLFK